MKYPLSQSQLGIYYACQHLEVNGGNYQIPVLYPLPDNVDLQRLREAVNRLLKAHPYLFSHLVVEDGEPMMEMGEFHEIEILEVRNLDEVRASFVKVMELTKDPLFRLEIYKTEEGNFFFVDFHHIIYDGSSGMVFSDELNRAYIGEDLVPELMNGGEVAAKEAQERLTPAWKTQREWFLNTFSNAEEVDSKPIPFSELQKNGAKGLRETNYILPVTDSLVKGLCQRFGVKKSTIFTAVWGKLLANYTAEDRASFCTIHNGRIYTEAQRTLTMMVRTLPVYMEMPSNKSVLTWLQEFENQQETLRNNYLYSFPDVCHDMKLQSSILFAYHGAVLAPASDFSLTLGEVELKGKDLRVARPGLALDGQLFATSSVRDYSDYTLRMSYDTALYSTEMIAQMVNAYAAILNSMLDAQTIVDLKAISMQQLQWLNERNACAVPEHQCWKPILKSFEEQVVLRPHHPCCVFEERTYTFAEIDHITSVLAQKIQTQVTYSDEACPVVSFMCPRSEWMVIFPISIVKAGCAYQPLDVTYPQERLNFMVKDAEAQLLLSTEELCPLLSEFEGGVIVVDAAKKLLEASLTPLKVITTKPDDALVLLYTSGSTGTPKGVVLTHRNFCNFIVDNTKYLCLSHEHRYLSYASYGFDAFQMDLWCCLSQGATLYVAPESIRYDLVALRDEMEKQQITHTFLTTQVGTQLAVNFPKIGVLQVLGVGGEKLVSLDPPSYRLLNVYGPTECTVYVTHYDVTCNEANIPIGTTTESSRLYIVNKDGQRVPMGAAGELWVAGAQVAQGYLRQPEKTQTSFIPNPFVSEEEREFFPTVYCTGDIVRYREDGEIEFVGRTDGQVKIRGFRVELKEVEAVIRDFPCIKEVTVQAFDLEVGGKAIVAYVVADETIDIPGLNAYIAAQKPPYMVPAVTIQLDEIPLNVNGKVDKKQLPKPQTSLQYEVPNTPTAPLNALEEELMSIIAPLVGCDDFSIVTPLAYLGLTSITSIKLSALLYKRFGVSISIQKMTHDASLQTIENIILQSLLKVDVAAKEETHDVETASVSHASMAPLSNAQKGVFFECMKNPDSTMYNVPQRVRFSESVSSIQIRDAVCKALALHPVLGAHFDNSREHPCQVADESWTPEVLISDTPADDIEKTFVQPFNLFKGPLYRAVVSGHTLFIDVHHLVMDGASVSLVMHQICDLLNGEEVKAEFYTFFDYAIDEQRANTSAAERFFKEQLSCVEEATSIPADLHGKEHEGQSAEVVQPVQHELVEQFAKTHGVTPAAVYLAAIQYIAARYGNTKDVCLCTVSSGRSNLRITDTVGMFVNTLALVSHITDQTTSDYIKSVAENFYETIKHENYPFADISNRYGINADLIFVYELGVLDTYTVHGVPLEMHTLELHAPKFKICLLVEVVDGHVSLVAQYNDALYSQNMMQRMLASLNQVVLNMISHPDAPVNKISILSPEQQREVDAMHYGGYYEKEFTLLHQGMERWVEKTPDAVAVIATDRTLTYQVFNIEGNRIAHALLKRGLKKGDPVVLLLPRTSHILCCMLGVMKAGGAFICCDPEYPTERIRLIADDSAAPYVVTTKNLVANYPDRGLDVEELMKETDTTQPDVEVLPQDLVYMIYTSGSTGRPKGVRVAHQNITTCLNVPEHVPASCLCRACNRFCSVYTVSFDAFIIESCLSTCYGNTFIFANEEEAKDPVALTHLMERTQADCIGSTSSRMLQYIELPAFMAALKKCKTYLQGGEKFSDTLLARLQHECPDLAILNGYGPTEISISCNFANLQHTQVITVGKPNPNYTEWVVDKDENELPVGVTGELCVGGDGVTIGYHNLPDKTAERYIIYGGMRAFKTGDYARWTEDGTVIILGRTDNQVKLRGLRIELGEVESVIAQVPGVKNVLVKICNIQGHDHLAAYFMADRRIDIAELKSTIGSTLTAYMVPTAYLQLEAFPITPNGKIDFRHLPQPLLSQSDVAYVAPANDAERFFASVFAEVLELDRVGATDSFFRLGGTSLVVMRVVIAAQKANYAITYADVFAHPTARELASLSSSSNEHSLDLCTSTSTPSDPDADVRDYDYTEINRILQYNTLDTYLQHPQSRPLGNVLLTGASGFLGIHVFRCLLQRYPDSQIHCLLRSKDDISAEKRFAQLCFYYFEKRIDNEIGKRIFIHEGDVTVPFSVEASIDTVINCAAIVKHFAQGTEIEDVNVGGVKNCIDFCLQHHARLIQVSTYSIAGASVNRVPRIKTFSEQMLYEGQRLHNQYIHSKLMGERLVLEAVAAHRLDAKIMRVGNLSARSSDGEFQINSKTNSFMGRIRVFQMLHVFPYSAYESPVEFSPVDEVAMAICMLSQTDRCCTVFHPYNNHAQMLGDVLRQLSSIGRSISMVEDSEYLRILNTAKTDVSKQEQLSSLLAYESKPTDEMVRFIPAENRYTHQVLLRLGFYWNATSWDYVCQFLNQIDTLEFFE